MESNIFMKFCENFEDKFWYDEDGVLRIWCLIDDIEGIYIKVCELILGFVFLLLWFRLLEMYVLLDFLVFIGVQFVGVEFEDEEDFLFIGGIDEEEGKSFEEEMIVFGESKW